MTPMDRAKRALHKWSVSGDMLQAVEAEIADAIADKKAPAKPAVKPAAKKKTK